MLGGLTAVKLTKDDFDIGQVGEWESAKDYFVGIQWLKNEEEGKEIRDQILKNQEESEMYNHIIEFLTEHGMGGTMPLNTLKRKLEDAEKWDNFISKFPNVDFRRLEYLAVKEAGKEAEIHKFG